MQSLPNANTSDHESFERRVTDPSAKMKFVLECVECFDKSTNVQPHEPENYLETMSSEA